MPLRRLLPCLLSIYAVLGFLSGTVTAQTPDNDSKTFAQATGTEEKEVSCLDNEPVIVSVASPEDIKTSWELTSRAGTGGRFEQLISAAIGERLGAHYSWGATGPFSFDCSGFVWSTFHSVGIDFERASARTLWDRFTPPVPAEQFKFGTLVFFSGLAHIGIVADEHGFYHASRHHGVVYSPFNDYWLSRLDGFRRVPVPAITITD